MRSPSCCSACEQRAEIAAIELNVSCPKRPHRASTSAPTQRNWNVVVGQRAAGHHKATDRQAHSQLRRRGACALAAQEGGADALSLINTLRAIALRLLEPPRPGSAAAQEDSREPAIRPVALAQVAAVAGEFRSRDRHGGRPDARPTHAQFLDVGARLVAVGTESFRDPRRDRASPPNCCHRGHPLLLFETSQRAH